MKKVATGRQIGIVVGRALTREFRELPEVRLWLGVIADALVDSDAKKSSIHSPARSFLTSERLALICDVIGLRPDWVQALIRDHAAWMRQA